MRLTIQCASGHRASIELPNIVRSHLGQIQDVITGQGTELEGDRLMGKCAVCSAPLSCDSEFRSILSGVVPAPTPAHFPLITIIGGVVIGGIINRLIGLRS